MLDFRSDPDPELDPDPIRYPESGSETLLKTLTKSILKMHRISVRFYEKIYDKG